MNIKTLLALVLLSTQLLNAQTKKEYLKQNRSDLKSPTFTFPQTNFKIIGFGAYHGSQQTEQAEHLLLQNLTQQKIIKYYLPETDFSIAHYFNEYLKSGDTLLLRDLVMNYGKRVPQEKSIEVYNKWKSLKQLNDGLAADNRLQVIGIDLMVSYKYTIKHLLQLLAGNQVSTQSLDQLAAMLKTDTTDYSPNYNSYSKKMLQEFVTDYDNHKTNYIVPATNAFAFSHILANIKLTFQKTEREKIIYDNYVALAPYYDFKSKPQFARFGFAHLEKEREGDYPSFFCRLIESKLYQKNEVIAIMGYLTKSRVLWDVKTDANKKYTGYTTEGGYGIGDYWKEYFKGIKHLKKTKVSDLTLFRLNNQNSPYKNGPTDLMEIKLFWKASNKKALGQKSTADFLDYAILISNSKANTPIEELE